MEKSSEMKNKTEDWETQLNSEIEKSIAEMESATYEFPEKFKKKDYVIVAIVAAICLAIIIVGAFI
jgi:hypothetical protein